MATSGTISRSLSAGQEKWPLQVQEEGPLTQSVEQGEGAAGEENRWQVEERGNQVKEVQEEVEQRGWHQVWEWTSGTEDRWGSDQVTPGL